jgi:hypothetical protein
MRMTLTTLRTPCGSCEKPQSSSDVGVRLLRECTAKNPSEQRGRGWLY